MGKSLFAGLLNSTWAGLLGLLVIPLYVKYLGVESYGLIGFYITAQSTIQVLELGMAPTVNREIARSLANNSIERSGTLLHSLAIIYWITGILILGLFYLLSGWIAGSWLNPDTISQATLERLVILIGAVIACRWPIALYQNALIGANRIVASSYINIAMITLANLGAIFVLAWVSPSLEAFFTWQAIVGIAQALLLRGYIWRIVGRTHATFSLSRLYGIWRFSINVGAITISSLVFSQLDKILISKLTDLEDLGRYMIATVLAGALYMLIKPTYTVIFPRMTMLVEREAKQDLENMYLLGTRLLAALLFPVAFGMAFFAEDILTVWMGSSVIGSQTVSIVGFLAIGTAINGVMHFPYALQLASGRPEIALKLNLLHLLALLPVLSLLTIYYGLVGAAAAWFSVQVIYLFIGTIKTHSELLKDLKAFQQFRNIGYHLLFSLASVMVLGSIAREFTESPILLLLACIAIILATTIIQVTLSPQLRSSSKRLIGDFGWRKYA